MSSPLSDQYQIEAVIGEGAFGRVYRARDLQLSRPVAVKELRKAPGEHGSSDYARFTERFRREARVQAQFEHPHLVHVYELLEPEPGVMYLITEFVAGPSGRAGEPRGVSLKEYLEQRGRLPVDEAVRIVRGVLAGLAVVHRHAWAIVHRDVKPSNILLTKEGVAKLTDFGLAQVLDESMRSQRAESHPGTVAYMSPEQATTVAYLTPASASTACGCIPSWGQTWWPHD